MDLSGLITALEPAAISYGEHQIFGTAEGNKLAGGPSPTVAQVLTAVKPALTNALDTAITAAGTKLGITGALLQDLRQALNDELNSWAPATT